PLPGLGNSTPVVWGDRIYLTTAVETDEVRAADEGAEQPRSSRRRGRRGGRGGRGQNNGAPKNVYDFRVIAVDRASGEVVWDKSVARAVPHEGGHKTGSQASNSPVTDGRFLYAHFGSRGVHCLTLDGEPVWSRTDLGRMRTRNQFGEGSSPALVDDTLIVNWDHEGDSFVVAIDARTGEDKWRKDRDEVTSWSTPVIAEVDGRKQAIISATGATRADDVANGDVIWSCKGMTVNSIPTPIVRDGVAYLMSGFRGAMLQAVRLAGAKGDVTDTDHVLWRHERQTSYVPSALLLGEHVYFLRSNSGVLSCVDAATGEVRYEGQRLAGLRTVYASPLAADGRVYLVSRGGATKVIKAGGEYVELATNELDDAFDASPIVLGDRMYLRGHDHLYCLGER
ncbi:MAG: PQQ-binding-like beta-propeller repeat protein, partial [Planctomycetota bacterium]|nr:PQQ-binding-like beta-propeller repeat protein [Planctomycetota bacterium]